MKLSDMSIQELISVNYACKCGRNHHMEIEHLAIGKGTINQLPDFLNEQKLKNGSPLSKNDTIFIVADIHTWDVAGKQVYELVRSLNYPTEYYIFPHEEMHTNEIFIV